MSVTRITSLKGRKVWDSRGRPTVEAEVILAGGAVGRAIAPAGASRGSNEAIDLRDGAEKFGGFGVGKALIAISDELTPALKGLDAADQEVVDHRIIEVDGTKLKSRLGGNATIAVSMATAHAIAASRNIPLWRSLGAERCQLPMPMIQLFGGGAHASGRIDLQDILVVPVGAASFSQATDIVAEIYRSGGLLMAERGKLHGVADEGGWWPEFDSNEEALDLAVQSIERAGFRPGEDVVIALDVAASQFGSASKYTLSTDRQELDTCGLIERLAGWCRKFPIASLEDPVAEDDADGMREVTSRLGKHLQIIGDDYLVTSADRVREAAENGACNSVLIKPNQVGTLTEAKAALDAAHALGWRTIISARSGETEDVTIVHLAVGWGAHQLKVGSFARSERMAKWNEALRIEEELGARATFAGRKALAGQH